MLSHIVCRVIYEILIKCFTVLVPSIRQLDQMASTPAPATNNAPQAHPRRPLQREGAQFFLTMAEQEIEAAMMRSSPPPAMVLGKRVHHDDQPGEGDDDDDVDEEGSSTPRLQPLSSISNLTAVTMRYASRKKLRPDQRDEIEAFLSVSGWPTLCRLPV